MFKIFVLGMLMLIIVMLVSLFSAAYFLLRDPTGSERLLRSFTLRISVAMLFFLLLWAAYSVGWMQPHGLEPVNHHKQQ